MSRLYNYEHLEKKICILCPQLGNTTMFINCNARKNKSKHRLQAMN